MLGKLSIIGVAAILTIPTAPSAQVGGAINPGVHIGPLLTPALRFVVRSFEVSLARISGLGARQVRIITVATIGIVRLPQSSADDGAHCDGQTSLLVGS